MLVWQGAATHCPFTQKIKQKCKNVWFHDQTFLQNQSKPQEHTFSADGLMRMHWQQLEMKISSAHTKRASRERISQIENVSQTKHGEVLHQIMKQIMALPICSLTCKSGITTLKDQESGWGYRPQYQPDFNHWFPQNTLLVGQYQCLKKDLILSISDFNQCPNHVKLALYKVKQISGFLFPIHNTVTTSILTLH